MNERILKYARAAELTNRDILMFGDNFQRFAELVIEDACGMMLSLEPMYPINTTVNRIRQRYGIKPDWQRDDFTEIE